MKTIGLMLCAALLLHGYSAALTEVHDAVKSGDPAAIRALLEKSPVLVSDRDEPGGTTLQWAAQGRALLC